MNCAHWAMQVINQTVSERSMAVPIARQVLGRPAGNEASQICDRGWVSRSRPSDLWLVPSLLPSLPAHPEVGGSRPCAAGALEPQPF